MRTVRISDLRRGHLRAEFVPKLRVESFHRSDSGGCTIVTIERHSPDRFSTGPLYMCAPRARGLAPSTPSRAFLLYRTDLPTLPRTAPFCVSAEVLANREIVVGANGFEPSTSWSRTRHLNPINALSGVAYGTRSVISPLSVVPTLYLEFGLNPCCERGFLCSLASLLPCCP